MLFWPLSKRKKKKKKKKLEAGHQRNAGDSTLAAAGVLKEREREKDRSRRCTRARKKEKNFPRRHRPLGYPSSFYDFFSRRSTRRKQSSSTCIAIQRWACVPRAQPWPLSVPFLARFPRSQHRCREESPCAIQRRACALAASCFFEEAFVHQR